MRKRKDMTNMGNAIFKIINKNLESESQLWNGLNNEKYCY